MQKKYIYIFSFYIQNPSSSSLELSRKSSSSSSGSIDLTITSDKHRHFHKGKTNFSNNKTDQLKRHDEHSIKSVRAKIAMFSTQNSIESSQATSSANNSESVLRSTPSPVGNSGRNSLSGQHTLRALASTSTSPSTVLSNAPLPSSSRLSTNGDEKLESDLVTPYHRSMINVSSNSPDPVVSQRRTIVGEKSQSHADLTKSNDLTDYKHQKSHLARVNSTENAGAEARLRNKAHHQYNYNDPQHGRSQSLLEIDRNNILLGERCIKQDQSTSNSGLSKNSDSTRDSTITKKAISDRSQSSSALLITSPIFDESLVSKTINTNSNLIHTRRRHTLTKLKGNLGKISNYTTYQSRLLLQKNCAPI